MKRACFAILFLLSSAMSFAQYVPVQANLADGTGAFSKTSYLHFELQNCGRNNPVIPGNSLAIVRPQFDLKPNQITGQITGQVVGNDAISCGGLTVVNNVPVTRWRIWLMKDATTSISPNSGQDFVICTNAVPSCAPSGGIWNPATAQPTTIVPPVPGFVPLLANPVQNQSWSQPSGTTGYLNGSFDFTGAIINGFQGGGGGSATPAGPDNSVQIAEAGKLAYDPAFQYDPLTHELTVGPPIDGTTFGVDERGLFTTSLPPAPDDNSNALATTSDIHGAHLDWGQLVNVPPVFPPAYPDSLNVTCPATQHLYGIAPGWKPLCSNDLAPSICLQANGVQIGCGLNTFNFVASAGLTIAAQVNQTTGVVTFNITGSTATQAEAPAFNPLPGGYPPGQTVALSCNSPSNTIYYTTDSSTPTHSSSVYTTPISVSATTIKALCASPGLADSNIQAGVYSVTAPAVNLNPTSLTFGTQLVGVPSYQPITLTNTGNAALAITSIVASGDFTVTSNCGSSVQTGGLCTINVQFAPTATGTRTGTLTITDNAAGSPHTASLTGAGALPTADTFPTYLDFGTQPLNQITAAQVVTITNGATVPLTISGVTIIGPQANQFTQQNNCGTIPPSGGTCTISVTFGPTASGTALGTLRIEDNAANSPQTVALSGAGAQPAAPGVGLSVASLTFATQKNGTSSAAQTVTLTNTGNAPLVIGAGAVTLAGANPSDFSQSNTCGVVSAGGTCTLSVTFTPTAVGTRLATLNIADNAAGSPQVVTLAGIGGVTTSTLSPGSLAFGNIPVGTSSSSQSVTFTNTSAFALSITSISATSGFAQSNNCGTGLAAGGSCTITVTFTPSAAGAASGTLTVASDSSNSPQTVTLSGTGTQPAVALSTNAINFGTGSAGNDTFRSLTVTNTGNANLIISSVTKTSDPKNAFNVTSNCGTLAPNGTCTVTVEWTPAAANTTYQATFSIAHNAPGNPTTFSARGQTNGL